MMVEPGSYLISYGAFPIFYQKFTLLLTNHRVKKIVRDISNGKCRKFKHPGIFYRNSDEERLQKNIGEFVKRCQEYKISDACISCGMCAKVCPTNNIKLENGSVVFGENCNQCMACIQWCPQRAIYVDDDERKRKRYHHIKINLTDMILRN